VQSIFLPDNGKIKSALVFAYDITDRKKHEESLKEELDIRTHFIDVLAHELKAPLSLILTSSEILNDLLKNSTDDVIKRLGSNILGSTKKLSDRLEDLLELARYSRGVFKLNTKPTNIVIFVEEVVARYKPSIDQSKHKLVLDILNQAPQIEIDTSRIEQVLPEASYRL
jgi:signal transduction histidine kinase